MFTCWNIIVFQFSYQESDSESVQGVDVYVTEDYGSKLYDSCKDVKYSLPNMRAMDFVGGGANNYTGHDPLSLLSDSLLHQLAVFLYL